MGTSRKLIVVSGSEHGVELLHFLSKRLGLSNKQAKRLLDARTVFVNNRRTWMARHPLGAGDRVEAVMETQTGAEPPALAVLHRDESYVVVNKPAGILTNGAANSVEAQLRAKLRRDIYAVHRLDRETSGCLLLATTPATRDAMIPLFQERDVNKTYHAIVLGSFPKSLRTLRDPIEGQTAVTHIRVLKAGMTASLVELKLETGRTHQIRIHLANARHPVLGDKSYMTSEMNLPALRRVPRQMLHAAALAFRHPATGADLQIRAPWPADFAACVSAFQLNPPKTEMG